jgi:bifunctional UDP-N-acetylglucosamine pyrophosphorylase/glucosamine-1-phosphate N-acetyltransferase
MGNFGEVKNSILGPGVKMGHFSYLGDAEVGAETNIGAGTITCNFSRDGKKNRSVIGERVFLGSDTLLVAPLQVGDGAATGAGSVVTRDVPPSSLAVGMPARVVRKLGEDDG